MHRRRGVASRDASKDARISYTRMADAWRELTREKLDV